MSHEITPSNSKQAVSSIFHVLKQRGINIKRHDVVEGLAKAMNFDSSNALLSQSENKPSIESAVEHDYMDDYERVAMQRDSLLRNLPGRIELKYLEDSSGSICKVIVSFDLDVVLDLGDTSQPPCYYMDIGIYEEDECFKHEGRGTLTPILSANAHHLYVFGFEVARAVSGVESVGYGGIRRIADLASGVDATQADSMIKLKKDLDSMAMDAHQWNSRRSRKMT